MDLINWIGIAIILCLIFLVGFFQLTVAFWTIIFGAALLFLTLFQFFNLATFSILLIFYILIAGFANLHTLRRRFLIKPLALKLSKRMPSISQTEKEALEAGNTWWEKELFRGKPNWKTLFAYPKPKLSAVEEDFLNHQVEILCEKINDWEITNELKDLPKEIWNYLKQEKFFGMVIPKEYGGLGFSALAHSTVVVKIATRSISAAVNTMVPNSLGPAELLLHYGTDEQKKYYLPRLATGEEIPCFGLTGPYAGSDASSIPDTGIVVKVLQEGKESLGIKLNWDKRYITLAPVASLIGLAFHLYDPDHLLSGEEDIGITLCLIPSSHPGVEIGHRHYPLHLAFMNGPTRGKDVLIPLDWIIGGQKMAGQGWRMLMECLSIGRSISLPALSTACGKITYRYTGAYARLRQQFNLPIANFDGVQEALAEIAGNTYLLEATRIMTAGAVDQGIKPSIASAIAKYQMTEIARKVIDHAMDIHAGHMIQTGPRNFLANAHFATPISITVEGANLLTRNLIIFGQGAIRCHPYLLNEIALLSNENKDDTAIDKILMSHLGFYIGNFLRNIVYGLTGGIFIFARTKNRKIKKLERQLTRMSAALSLLADTSLMLLGGELKRRERISARLGDILSQLYLASAVLKYYHDNNALNSDVNHVCWSIQTCLYKIQFAIDELLNNFPYPLLGWFFYSIIFPLGTAYHHPKDLLEKEMVGSMLTPGEIRDRLTRYCYLSQNKEELIYQLELGLKEVTQVDPISKKFHKAIQNKTIPAYFSFEKKLATALSKNILSEDEIHQLKNFEKLRSEILKVNEFSFDLSEIVS